MSGRHALLTISAAGAVAVACLAPWPFASVEPFWSALACGLVLAAAVPGLLAGAPALPRRAAVAAAVPALVAALALVPLPAALVGTLSPGAREVLTRAGIAAAAGPRPFSLFPPATLDALVLLGACGAVGWLAAGAATRERSRTVVAVVFVTGGALLAAFGLVQRLVDPDPQRMFWSIRIYEAGTPFGPYVNRNHFGGAMLLFTGVAAGRALAASSAGRRGAAAVTAAVAALTAFALLATSSRGAILGLCAVLVVLVGAARGRRRLRLAVVAVGAAGLLLGLLAALGLFDELAGRLFHVYGRWENRFLVQADALRVALSFPVLGTGPGTFPWVYHAFQRVDDARHFEDAHSDWVQVAMESGLLGLGAALFVVWTLARATWRAARSAAPARWHALGAAAGCAGIAVHGFVETNLHVPANALLASAAAGLAYGAAAGVSAADRGADTASRAAEPAGDADGETAGETA